jgi:hypothetical protein
MKSCQEERAVKDCIPDISKELSGIDKVMLPILKHLWDEGITTIGSCAGHKTITEDHETSYKPWRSFLTIEYDEAGQELAAYMKKKGFIVDDHPNDDEFLWIGMEGRFDKSKSFCKNERNIFLKALIEYKTSIPVPKIELSKFKILLNAYHDEQDITYRLLDKLEAAGIDPYPDE